MPETNWGEFWWSNITGPSRVVKEVAGSLRSSLMVVLHVPCDLPWRHDMRRCVEENLHSVSGGTDVVVQVVDAMDELGLDTEPGKFILDRFALRDVRYGYRGRGGESVQKYIVKNKVLSNTVVWLKGLNESQTIEWLDFCDEYKPDQVSDGLFVIETHNNSQHLERSHLVTVDYEACVREYDVQLFSSFLLEGNETTNYSDGWKKYVSSLVTHLCKTDAEVAEELIRELDFTKDDSLLGIKAISEAPEFSRRGNESTNHVLSLWRKGASRDLEQRIWSAQIEVLFPLIERQRLRLVNALRDELRSLIDEGEIVQFNEPISDPNDVELGTIAYLMALKENGIRLLNVPDYDMRQQIFLLKDCRNRLAHTECCSLEQITQLLNLTYINGADCGA